MLLRLLLLMLLWLLKLPTQAQHVAHRRHGPGPHGHVLFRVLVFGQRPLRVAGHWPPVRHHPDHHGTADDVTAARRRGHVLHVVGRGSQVVSAAGFWKRKKKRKKPLRPYVKNAKTFCRTGVCSTRVSERCSNAWLFIFSRYVKK